MKFFAILSLFFITSLTAKTLPPIEKVISAIELTPDFLKELLNDETPDLAIELPQGSAIPIHFLIKSPISIFTCNPNLTVQITETSYLRVVKRKVYMSKDLISWDRPDRFFQGKVESTAKMSADKSHAIVEIEIQ